MMVLVFAFWVMLGVAFAGAAKTLDVREAGPVTSIKEAIRSASSGDIIRVERGTYAGNLLLDKALTLEGIGRPVIRGDGQGSVLTVVADGCVIRGFVVEHGGTMLVDEDSGILLKSGRNRIEHNEIQDVLFGLYFYRSNDNVAADNIIRGRPYLEIGERGSGIHIWDSVRNAILRNTISHTRDGMYLQNASDSVIAGNKVHDLRYGLHYMFSNDNRFENNDFFDNVAGAAIMYSHNIAFRRNAFVHNRGFSSYGILFQDSHECLAEENTISDNVAGIFMEALTNTVFRRNTIAANDVAIEAFSSATANTFTENNFVANLSPFQLVGKVTDTRWSDGKRGNYWSDYDGYDLNGDGIGDVPFKIQNAFEHLEGNFPRLRIYLLSPASAALALSERFLPILEFPKTSDPFPLMRPVPLEVREPGRSGASSRRLLSVLIACGLIGGAFVIFGRGRNSCSK